tara:strand:- start:376 stop:576 length:201 start_codon:yes stop_codon:yes gene_type:complete
MQPPKTFEELKELYSDLEPWQRDELEDWHRGWITKLMTGEATSEEYNPATPLHSDPHHPEDGREDL